LGKSNKERIHKIIVQREHVADLQHSDLWLIVTHSHLYKLKRLL